MESFLNTQVDDAALYWALDRALASCYGSLNSYERAIAIYPQGMQHDSDAERSGYIQGSRGNTTLEAIACDLPVVTCPGEFRRGRHAYAMLRVLDSSETIAQN